MRTSKTQWLLTSSFCIRVFATMLWAGLTAGALVACQKEEKAGSTPPPPAVEVVELIQKDVTIHSEWVGTMDGSVNATIRPQVTGYLVKQNYKEGDSVKKGQLLFEIDPRTFQAAVNQAKAALDQAVASLERAKAEVAVVDARWVTAKANLGRIKPLAEQNAVSKKDLDDATGIELSTRSAVQAAKAAVVAAQATVGASKAELERAQLDLEFTRVISPIDGIAGAAKAQIGNLVGPGSTEELTTVSQVDPIKVYAALSEQEYLKAAERQEARRGEVPIEMILADGSVYPHKGEFSFADRQVDVRTGTIRVTLLFPNPSNLLRPGQFARIRAEMEMKKGALTLPQRALTDVQGKQMVAVVGPDNKVSIKPVKAGARFGQLRVIEEGLQAGQKVVAEGIQKVRDGVVVSPLPYVAEKEAGQKQEVKREPEKG